MKILLFILFFISLSIFGCKAEDEATSAPAATTYNNANCPAANRLGAVCKDGTQSSATGSGACSSHGGVNYWICSTPKIDSLNVVPNIYDNIMDGY